MVMNFVKANTRKGTFNTHRITPDIFLFCAWSNEHNTETYNFDKEIIHYLIIPIFTINKQYIYNLVSSVN